MDDKFMRNAFKQEPIPDDIEPAEISEYIMIRYLYKKFKENEIDKESAESIKKVISKFDEAKIGDKIAALRYFTLNIIEDIRKEYTEEKVDFIQILLQKFFEITNELY